MKEWVVETKQRRTSTHRQLLALGHDICDYIATFLVEEGTVYFEFDTGIYYAMWAVLQAREKSFMSYYATNHARYAPLRYIRMLENKKLNTATYAPLSLIVATRVDTNHMVVERILRLPLVLTRHEMMQPLRNAISHGPIASVQSLLNNARVIFDMDLLGFIQDARTLNLILANRRLLRRWHYDSVFIDHVLHGRTACVGVFLKHPFYDIEHVTNEVLRIHANEWFNDAMTLIWADEKFLARLVDIVEKVCLQATSRRDIYLVSIELLYQRYHWVMHQQLVESIMWLSARDIHTITITT